MACTHLREFNSSCFVLSVPLSPVCVGLQRPAQLHVAVWSGWPSCPRERSYCQQHPPDYQVRCIFENMFFKVKTMEWQCLAHNNPLWSSVLNFLWLSSFCSSDLVIVVWRQRIRMKRPPVPLLLARRLRPETTPLGTAAAISQYLFSPLTNVLFYILFTPMTVLSACSIRHQTASLDLVNNSVLFKDFRRVNVFCRRVLNPLSWRMISECGGCCASCDQAYETYSTVSNGT